MDTEFVRVRTFFPHPGLFQVGDGEGVWLLDTVAIGDLDAFGRILPEVQSWRVLHAGSEDLGLFWHVLHSLPTKLFDTQVAASLCGLRFSISYQGLVEEILGIKIDKGETRSDWLKRPLDPSQLAYAAQDVSHLGEIFLRLRDRLASLGRLEWLQQECDVMLASARQDVPPDKAWQRIRGRGNLNRRSLTLLQSLAAWREREAVRRDLARNFVVRDRALLEIARRRPRSPRDLEGVPELGTPTRKRYGEVFANQAREITTLPESELLPLERRLPKLRGLSSCVRRLQSASRRVAEELEIAPELLVQRRVLDKLARSYLTDGTMEMPAELAGWREPLLDSPLRQALQAI